LDLARRLVCGRVVAVDRSTEAIREARHLATDLSVANVAFVQTDSQHLPFNERRFDVVHAHQLLQHVGDPVGTFREMRRVCAPGGIVAARDGDYGGMFWFPQIPELDEWRTVYQAVARSNGAEPDAGRRLLAWALEAGFTDVEASASVWYFTSREDRERWACGWAERILHSAVADQALAVGVIDVPGLRRIADAWRSWASLKDGWLCVPHGEVIARR
jgi:SAM-dependent methyltransferase